MRNDSPSYGGESIHTAAIEPTLYPLNFLPFFDPMDYSILTMEQMESVVMTLHKEPLLRWVFDNCDYSAYEHLCFITGDAG